jgi:hypothetical protein
MSNSTASREQHNLVIIYDTEHLAMSWQEKRARGTTGMASCVRGLLRVWAYNLVRLPEGRCLRAAR